MGSTPAMAQQPVEKTANGAIRIPGNVIADKEVQTRATADTRISVNFRDMSIVDALNEVMRLSGVPINYVKTSIPANARVTLRANKERTIDIVTSILKGTGVQAELGVAGSLKLVRPDSVRISASSETGVVMGTVTDSATGHAIAGVAISLQPSGRTALSNEKGAFSIHSVMEGSYIISAKVFGFRSSSRRITVTKGVTATVPIVLPPVATQLSGVVTTVTGEQRKVEVGNDITTIKVADVIRTNPVSNVSELLATRVPGLYAAPTSGQPGAPTRIRIRGVSSINSSNEPIIVVDGVQLRNETKKTADNAVVTGVGFEFSPLDQIDVNSIETVEVLKGPSAVALYGSDAANGVIVVTTKKGIAGDTRWTSSASWGSQTMPGKWPNNYFSWGTSAIGGLPDHCTQDLWSQSLGCHPDSLVVYQLLNSRNSTVFGRGLEQQYSLGVSGGVKGITYSITTSLNSTLGLMKLPASDVDLLASQSISVPAWQKRPQAATQRSGTAVTRMDLGSQSNMTISTGLTNSKARSTPLSDAMARSVDVAPPKPVYLDDGSIGVSESGLLSAVSNFRERRQTSETGVRSSLILQSTALQNTNTMLSFGVDNRNLSQTSYLANGDCYIVKRCDDSSYARRSTGNATTTDIKVNLSARAFGHRLLNMVPSIGGNLVQMASSDMSLNAFGLPAGVRDVRSGLAERVDFNEVQSSRKTVGGYVEARVNIADRLWLPFAMRTDAGSALGGNVMPKFPKLGFSYLLSDQPGFRNLPLVGSMPLVRLRTAFGVAGKQPLPAAKYRTYKEDRNSGGFDINSIGNPFLLPERTRELELGFDADMIENERGQLSMTATWASKKTNDLLVEGKLPASMGNFRRWMNLGDVNNTSIELSLNSSMRLSGVSWSSDVGLSTLKNQLTRLATTSDVTTFDGIKIRNVVGYPLNGRWAKEIVGYFDRNKDGIIDADEVAYSDTIQYLGSPLPKFTLNAQQQFTFFGNTTVSSVFGYDYGMMQIRNKGMYDQANNDPSLSLREQAYGLFSVATRAQEVSTLRWTSLQVNYMLPKHISNRIIKNGTATISAFGKNVGLWSTYRGKDPNVGATGEQVIDRGQLPTPRSWGFSVRIN